MNKSKIVRLVLLASLSLLMFSAVGLTQAQEPVTIKYVLWDTNQLPPYQQCADDFMAANPNIAIEIEQLGWNDYWSSITVGFVSGDAPDVFTNHLAKYPEFVALEQLVDIQPLVERDGLDLSIYYPGLADLWTREGRRFGLPKDWDTIGVAYNVEELAAAGIDPAIMDEWTWNPEDGGTFYETIAALTIDANGVNALDPNFDAANVTQYGFVRNGSGGFAGQTQWSSLAASTGWTFNNGIWGNEYYYDDPRFIDTVQWWADLSLVHGVSPSQEEQGSLGTTALFQSGSAAMSFIGSWQIGEYLGSEFEVGFGRLPAGPEGRMSMFNGLADSIWVGSPHQEEAWEWVKYLASPACQLVVGQSGVVFPASREGAEASLQVREDMGVDVSAFVEQADEEGGTFLFPITDFGGEISTIMDETMDSIMLGQQTAEAALPVANEEINALFQ